MSSTLPLILLPPSEGKAPGGSGAPWSPGSMSVDLDDRRAADQRCQPHGGRVDVTPRGQADRVVGHRRGG